MGMPLVITPIASPILALIPAIRHYKGKPVNKKLITVLVAIPLTALAIQLLMVLSNFPMYIER